MACMLESYGLDFFSEEEETFSGLVGYVVSEGKPVTGYYGTPYFYLPAGDSEFWADTARTEDGKLEVTRLHTHGHSSSVWEMIYSGIQINEKSHPKTERVLMMNGTADSGGLLPVNIINADVLPSFMEGDKLKLQVVAPCLDINYYKDEDEYADTIPEDKRGKKWLMAENALMPIAFLVNHSPDTYDPDREYGNDDCVSFRSTVKALYHGRFKLGENEQNTFIRCIADTRFGEIVFEHTLEQVPEEQRNNIRIGAVISGTCIISADAAIYDYQEGIVRDFDNDLRLLRYTLAKGESERLRSVLTETSVYETDSSGKTYTGPDEIIDRFSFVHEASKGRYTAHFAEITRTDSDELDYPVGTRCIVIGDTGEKGDDKEERLISIAFISVDENGYISRIKVSEDSRYHFRTEKPERRKTPLDDIKIPDSVIEPIMTRARFHGLIDRDTDDERITSDPAYESHKNNAEWMLEALENDPQPDRETAVNNIFGYLFAKSIEQTINEEQDDEQFSTRLTASYSPNDAYRGILRTAADPEIQEALEAEMDLGRQFGRDFWLYLKMTGADESAFADIFTQAAVAVQRIGDIYAADGFRRTKEEG